MIDASERALLQETVHKAIAGAGATADGGAAVDAVLGQIGWLELLEAEPRDAIDIVFSELGAANATATALDDVLASVLGAAPAPTAPSLVTSSQASPTCTTVAATSVQKKMVCAPFASTINPIGQAMIRSIMPRQIHRRMSVAA